MTTAGARAATSAQRLGVGCLLVGAAVAVALGVYGSVQDPPGEPVTTLGFDTVLSMKVWLASITGGLAIVQLMTAVGMYTRGGRGLARVHRVSGTLAVLVSLPVAYHCLWLFGFAGTDGRVLVHSVAGCLVYGALTTKLLALHLPRTPSWLVTVAGSLLLTSVATATLTSAVWYFAVFGAP